MTQTYVLQLSDQSTLSAGYDVANSRIIFEARVKVGNYLAIGFGTDMTTAYDMISWDAGSTAALSQCQKLSSSTEEPPTVASDQSFLTTATPTLSNGFINFSTVRPLTGSNS